MNNLVNEFFWLQKSSYRKCIWGSKDLRIGIVDHSRKTKEEYNNSKKQVTLDISIKMN